MTYRYKLILSLLLLLTAATTSFAQDKTLVEVFVGNEGNFNAGNATVTRYVVESGTATDGIFSDANGVAIGDVVQSLSWIDNKIFAVINNSQKIVVMDPENFTQTGIIDLGAGSSPREILQVSDTKAYVTDLYGSKVYIVDLTDYSVSETTIPMGTNADYMAAYDGYAYVANHGYGADSTIFKVDVSSDLVVDTLKVSRGPSSMVVDADGVLWVVATGYAGDYDASWNIIEGTSEPGGIHGIDLSTGEEVAFAELASAGSDIGYDSESETVYVYSGGIRAFDVDTKTMATDTLISGYFYGFAYDDVSNQLFTADAKDYSSAGAVAIYDASGEKSSEFSTGIIPGSFLFVYSDMITSNEEELSDVTAFSLSQNYPNPFNPTTNIEFSLAESGTISLKVFNTRGQLVATLAEGGYSYGSHSITFDASALSSGVYFYRLQTETGVQMKKMLLVK